MSDELVKRLRELRHDVTRPSAVNPHWARLNLFIVERQEAADEIERLRYELERTRQAWVNKESPDCEDVCMVACKGPCEGVRIDAGDE